MLFLFMQLWIWLLAAGVLGLCVGWLIWGRTKRQPNSKFVELEQKLLNTQARCSALQSELDSLETIRSGAVSAVLGRGEFDRNQRSLPGVENDWQPESLDAPRNGVSDNLQRIKGVGPVIERKLNAMGIYHYAQIAEFSDENIRWVDAAMSFPGRIMREQWVSQARALAEK